MKIKLVKILGASGWSRGVVAVENVGGHTVLIL